jgi:hypothetical protein
MFLAHMNRHCGVTAKAKGRISVAKHHWRPSVYEFLKEEKNERKDISHLFHFPTLSAWENVNKADSLDRYVTPNKHITLQDATNLNSSSSNSLGRKKMENGFSVFLTPNFTENECDAYIAQAT